LHAKNHEDLCTFAKVIVKKNEWHLFYLDTMNFDAFEELQKFGPTMHATC